MVKISIIVPVYNVKEYLEERSTQRNKGGALLSAWTIHTEAAALHKLFGIKHFLQGIIAGGRAGFSATTGE